MKFLVLAVSMALSFSAFAQATHSESGSSSVSVKVENGAIISETTNTSFDLGYAWNEDKFVAYVIKKSVTRQDRSDSEGGTGHIKVEARRSDNLKKVLWRLDEEAHGGSSDGNDLYLTWQDGCCASMTGYRAYNLATGKLITAYDANQGVSEGQLHTPFVIEIPNTPLKRFIGVLSPDAARDFEGGELDGMVMLASVTYASLDGALQIVDVYGKIPEGWSATVESSLNDTARKSESTANRLTHWASDGEMDPVKALNGLELTIKFQTETLAEVKIPVRQDRLSLTNATLPADYRLVPRK